MRFPTTARSVASALASLTMFAAPAALHAAAPAPTAAVFTASDAPTAAGLYNLTVKSAGGAQRIDLLLDASSTGYTGRMLTFEQEITVEKVVVDKNTISVTMNTNFGRSTVVLHVTDKGIDGTLKVRNTTLAVTGERAY